MAAGSTPSQMVVRLPQCGLLVDAGGYSRRRRIFSEPPTSQKQTHVPMHTEYLRELQLDLDFTVRRSANNPDLEAWIRARIERAPSKRLAALDLTMAFIAERNGGVVQLNATIVSIACESAEVIARLFGPPPPPFRNSGGGRWLRKTFHGLAVRQASPATPSAGDLRRSSGVGESAPSSPPAPPRGGPKRGGL
jgi:hypothetical protein